MFHIHPGGAPRGRRPFHHREVNNNNNNNNNNNQHGRMHQHQQQQRQGGSISRKLWDDALQKNVNHHQQQSTSNQEMDYYLHIGKCWTRAILYEVQPVRFKQIAWKEWYQYTIEVVDSLKDFITQTLPQGVTVVVMFLKERSSKEYMCVAGLVAYYYFLRWIHEVLLAGPIVLSCTILYIIWTVGLTDNERDGRRGRGELSAYSVFNRGFEQLLGSINANALVAQYVGLGNFDDNDNNNENNNNIIDRQPVRPMRRNANDDNDDNAVAGNRNIRRSGKRRRRNFEQRQAMREQRAMAQIFGQWDDDVGFGGDHNFNGLD